MRSTGVAVEKDLSSSPEGERSALDFWERAHGTESKHGPVALKPNRLRAKLLEIVGDVSGKRVLDIGCGGGHLSVMLAARGARVTAVDYSENAIAKTVGLAERFRVADRVRGVCADLATLQVDFEPFDAVVGELVLHHIEPFDEFVQDLHRLLVPGGCAAFVENNARSGFLMAFRKYVAGRGGIPRFSDGEEYPLEPEEIDMLREQFDHVEIHYPKLVFFRLMNTYLLRRSEKLEPLRSFNSRVDDFLHRHVPVMRKYSYRQVIEIRRAA